MGEIEKDLGMSRPDFIYEVIDIMETHKINVRQAFYVYGLIYKIEYLKSNDELNNDLLLLVSKGLVTAKGLPNVNKLFGKKKKRNLQIAMSLNFETNPIGNDETLVIAQNLEKEFVIDKYLDKGYIKKTSDQFFQGDEKIAKYFLIFRSLFPGKDAVNSKWNKHFGFTYIDTDRWEETTVISRKFRDIYKSKDIGLFLSGLYYYMQDSIDFNKGECYCVKPNKFLDRHTQWYEVAKERHKSNKNKNNESIKSF